ncbi:MAG: BrnA antitoxin family protein [Bacilli bacterium]|nr:BrnA antitoxin family protein [Bacilli bacterium]
MKKKRKEEYDFTEPVNNPYAKQLKKQITININEDVLDYFKSMAVETGIPYQTLINLYLLDCKNNFRNSFVIYV